MELYMAAEELIRFWSQSGSWSGSDNTKCQWRFGFFRWSCV